MRKVFLNSFLLKISEKLLDIVFPPSEVAKNIKKMSPEDLLKKCQKAKSPTHPFIYSIFNYKDKFIEELIWELKFYKNKDVAKILGPIIYEKIPKEKAILIPIPISKTKKREKGFNQTELLCEEIIKNDKDSLLDYMPNILIKNKHTKNQHDIKDKKERLSNLEGAFTLNKLSVVSDQKIIIIDDVYTTGATLLEIKKVLEQAGAKSVIAITVAH